MTTEAGRRQLQDWHHILAMCLVMAALAGGLAYLLLAVDLIPDPGSIERGLIDRFVRILLAIAATVFVIVVTALGYSLVFFRRRPGDDTDARPVLGKTSLELTWTFVPLAIVIALSIHGARVLDAMIAAKPEYETTRSIFSLGAFVPGDIRAASDAPDSDLVVNVTASRFVWQFDYPDYGITSAYQLEVPVGRRVILNLTSKDVIHSFWVQEWGPKQDAVPGLSPVLRITPTVIGQYAIQCSQLCGHGHTTMTAPAYVVSAEDFDKWVHAQASSAGASSPPAGSHVLIDLTAESLAFDKKTITVPAGVMVMINFDNEDKSVPHNFALYKTSAAAEPLFRGDIVTGPKRITYNFMAPAAPGTYFFRCDAHPDAMTGTFVVK